MFHTVTGSLGIVGYGIIKGKMAEELTLNRLEHHLLSMQVDDVEPMFILYADTVRDVKGADLDQVLQALVNLVEMKFSTSYLVEDRRGDKVDITLELLRKRFEGMSEDERRRYPSIPEYYFEITPEGKVEEAKDVYSVYYP
jgi:hypothetical protein